MFWGPAGGFRGANVVTVASSGQTHGHRPGYSKGEGRLRGVLQNAGERGEGADANRGA